MKKMCPFKLRSGNSPLFKMMGSAYPQTETNVEATSDKLKSPLYKKGDSEFNLLDHLDSSTTSDTLGMSILSQRHSADASKGRGGYFQSKKYSDLIGRLGYKNQEIEEEEEVEENPQNFDYGPDNPYPLSEEEKAQGLSLVDGRPMSPNPDYDPDYVPERNPDGSIPWPPPEGINYNDLDKDEEEGSEYAQAKANIPDNLNSLKVVYKKSDLKNLGFGSQERVDFYNQFNWAQDHTTTGHANYIGK
jgi:hypothetical protein